MFHVDANKLSRDGTTIYLLRGWKFRTGDSLEWAKPSFDDSKWIDLYPFYFWELQNVDYDGFAWYRVKFTIPEEWKNKASNGIYFYLGKINDCDQTFLNGKVIGENGIFVPEEKVPKKPSDKFSKAKGKRNVKRKYTPLANDSRIEFGKENVLAVRIYDAKGYGGFNKSLISVSITDPQKNYVWGWNEEYARPVSGKTWFPKEWKYKKGDNPDWSKADFNDETWRTINIEDEEGFEKHDGVFWYRTQIKLPSSLNDQKYFNDEIIIDLGRVHDKIDIYVNGKSLDEYRVPCQDIVKYYPLPLRQFYIIPVDADFLKWDEDNVIAVRQYNNHDLWGAGFHGGRIYTADFFDLMHIKFNSWPYEIQSRIPIDIIFEATNVSNKKEKIKATLEYKVIEGFTEKVVDQLKEEVSILNNRINEFKYRFLPTKNTDYLLWYKLTEKETGKSYTRERLLGYVKPETRPDRQPKHYDHSQEIKFVDFKVQNKTKDKCIPINASSQEIDGLLGSRMELNNEKAIWGFLKDFEVELLEGFYDRPQKDLAQGEFLGKYVHGAVRDLEYRYNESCKRYLDKLIDILIASMEPDGYSGTHIYPVRWLSLDVWEQKYNLYALLYYYRLTGYELALDAAQRIADLIFDVFGDSPGKLNIIKTGYHIGMQPTSILEPMVLLYRYTGEQKYFDFCTHIVNMWEKPYGPKLVGGMLKTKSFIQTGNAKGYEQLSCYLGLIRYYQLTGNDDLRKALEYAFEDVANNRCYITGSTSELEHVMEYVTIGDIATWPCESCVTAHWMQFCKAMFYLTGELKYIEEIEKNMYNHLLASENPHTGGICYYTPLQNKKPFSYGISCCNSSLPRAIAMIPDVLWTKFTDGGLAVLIYNPGKIADFIKTQGGEKVFVRLQVQTDFLKSGDVTITVNPEREAEFKLSLRVPRWTNKYKAVVGGKTYFGQPGNYLNIIRTWRPGDKIYITIDMNDHFIQGQKFDESKPVHKISGWNANFLKKLYEKYSNFSDYVALKHGPQILAIDGILNKKIDIDKIRVDLHEDIRLHSVNDILPNSWVGDEAYTSPAVKGPDGERVILVPFSDAGQLGGDVRVWIKKK